MIIGGREFKNYTYCMAIINLTPDSFYVSSRANLSNVLFKVERAIAEGASVIDVGAQSTRPGYEEISPEEEAERLCEPLVQIKRNFDVPVSVDTYYSSVAGQALSAGADMINDVWGLSRDEYMAKVIAQNNASVCIMHNSKTALSGNPLPQVISFLKSAAAYAVASGIAAEKICIDGGIGFAKDGLQSIRLLNEYEKLSDVGYPLLLGASRKSLFGGNVEDRLPATLNATRLAAKKGVLFVRVHDVQQNVAAIKEEYGY